MKVFVPLTEELIEQLGGLDQLESLELVPFDLDYECLRTPVPDGTPATEAGPTELQPS